MSRFFSMPLAVIFLAIISRFLIHSRSCAVQNWQRTDWLDFYGAIPATISIPVSDNYGRRGRRRSQGGCFWFFSRPATGDFFLTIEPTFRCPNIVVLHALSMHSVVKLIFLYQAQVKFRFFQVSSQQQWHGPPCPCEQGIACQGSHGQRRPCH
jgi:hypothetical protein